MDPILPRDWKIPLDKAEFEKDPQSVSKKAFDTIEDMYMRLSNAIPLLPNKGDIAVGIGSGLVDVFAVGADGKVLTALSTEATGFTWTTPSVPGDTAFPAGTKMWFYQNVAPTYWTIDTTPADALLAVKGGSQAFNAAGGTQTGTWTQPNHTHTGPSHTHTGPSHTHTQSNHVHQVYNQVASNAHDQFYNSSGVATDFSQTVQLANSKYYIPLSLSAAEGGAKDGPTDWYTCTTISASSTGAEGTGATGAEGTGATGNGATANTWRPLAQLGIICTKD